MRMVHPAVLLVAACAQNSIASHELSKLENVVAVVTVATGNRFLRVPLLKRLSGG